MVCSKSCFIKLPRNWGKDAIISTALFMEALLPGERQVTTVEVYEPTGKHSKYEGVAEFDASVSPTKDFKTLDVEIDVAIGAYDYLYLKCCDRRIRLAVSCTNEVRADTLLLALQNHFADPPANENVQPVEVSLSPAEIKRREKSDKEDRRKRILENLVSAVVGAIAGAAASWLFTRL